LELIDIYNPDVIIGTESWLREDIVNAEVFRDEYTTFRRDRITRGGGVFICVKKHTDCVELWVDEDFEMIAVEVNGKDPRRSWEIVGIYRAPNEDMGERCEVFTAVTMKKGVFWDVTPCGSCKNRRFGGT
jgi:hypothetical protein